MGRYTYLVEVETIEHSQRPSTAIEGDILSVSLFTHPLYRLWGIGVEYWNWQFVKFRPKMLLSVEVLRTVPDFDTAMQFFDTAEQGRTINSAWFIDLRNHSDGFV